MTNKNNPILFLFAFLFFFFYVSLLPAEDISAEIINIDQNQKIVFIDIGRDVLAVGDVMSVNGADHPVYLEVLQVSDAVSKLRVSKKEKFHSKTSDLDSLTVGMKAVRVFSVGAQPHVVAPEAQETSPITPVPPAGAPAHVPEAAAANTPPSIDAEAFVKPDISKESFQSLDARLNKMVDNNIKLLDALSQCQAAGGGAQKLTAVNEELKKQLDELNAKYVTMVLEKDKYKKQGEDLLGKLNELKGRLDRLDSVIGEHLK